MLQYTAAQVTFPTRVFFVYIIFLFGIYPWMNQWIVVDPCKMIVFFMENDNWTKIHSEENAITDTDSMRQLTFWVLW